MQRQAFSAGFSVGTEAGCLAPRAHQREELGRVAGAYRRAASIVGFPPISECDRGSVMSPIDKVLDALKSHERKLRPSRDGWSARCPAHEDKRASLSISEGPDGKVLLCCFAGCGYDQVVAALDLNARDLLPPKEMIPKPNGG